MNHIVMFYNSIPETFYCIVKRQICYALLSMEKSARYRTQWLISYVPAQNVAAAHFEEYLLVV